jgi:hypothetical protein
LANSTSKCTLILGTETAWYFGVFGKEAELSSTSQGGIITGGILKPCIAIEDDEDLGARRVILETAETRKGYALGDTTKGGRDATPEELETLSGFHYNGVQNGLLA